ncbi:hypothetical protein ACP4OV_005952 [Aristida adscensionis]
MLSSVVLFQSAARGGMARCTTQPQQRDGFDNIVVVDFEAACEGGGMRIYPQEINEFPWSSSMPPPTAPSPRSLSMCTDIRQDQVDACVDLPHTTHGWRPPRRCDVGRLGLSHDARIRVLLQGPRQVTLLRRLGQPPTPLRGGVRRSFLMDIFVSAVLGDLVSRSISFVVNKYYRQQKGMEENLERLHRVMLRTQAIVEEADRRHITNQAMLQQLQMLKKAMFKGFYLLNTVRYRVLQQKSSGDQVRAQYFALTKFSPTKRLCISTRSMDISFQGDGAKEVHKTLGTLHSIIDDMAEFMVFLKFYPPIGREPYSQYLFMDNCMFGHQAEMEEIINFLLQPERSGAQGLQVLPIIGPPRVGKSTLVEHACYDERVHSHFSLIILCSGQGGDIVKKQTHGSHERVLVIMDLADDLVPDERQCKELCSSRSHMPSGSKEIITSRSENILRLGTTRAIRLDFLSQEAYWYFFKVMAFGSTNPDEHPELASIAMEIAAELDGSFLCANICCGYLRANMSIQFWRKILELERNHVQRNILHFGERPQTLLRRNQEAYVWSMSNSSVKFKVLYYQTHSPQNEAPNTLPMLHGVQSRTAKDHGKLDLLVWKSRIPPYHSYVMSCEMEAQHMMPKKRPHSMV